MHDQGICHRDLKTENILLDSNYNLIIADFGYGSNQELNSTAVGTISYMAPEVFEGRPYIGKVVDIFGIGIILFMMKKIKPFQKADVFDPIYSNMINQEQHKFWEIHSSQNEAEFSEEYKDLINQLLAYQPTHRLSISEIKQHPWYNGPMWSSVDIKKIFKQRKEELRQSQMADPKEEKVEHEYDEDIFKLNTRTRSGSEYAETVHRIEEDYDPDYVTYYKFFSTSDLQALWNCLGAYAEEMTQGYEFAEENYSVTVNIMQFEGRSTSQSILLLLRHIFKPSILICQCWPFCIEINVLTEGKDKPEIEVVETPLKFTVNILKVPGTEKHWVEGLLLLGDRFEFTTVFKDLLR